MITAVREVTGRTFQPFRLRLGAGHDAARPSRVEGFGRTSTVDESIGEIDGWRTASGRAEALSAVRDKPSALLIGELSKGAEIAKSTTPINGHNCGSPC